MHISAYLRTKSRGPNTAKIISMPDFQPSKGKIHDSGNSKGEHGPLAPPAEALQLKTKWKLLPCLIRCLGWVFNWLVFGY